MPTFIYVLWQSMSELLLLTSPPASGKTFWIRSFAETLSDPILVISPLRALADECRKNWNEKIMVMTPEEWMKKKPFARVVIFDEFHLFRIGEVRFVLSCGKSSSH